MFFGLKRKSVSEKEKDVLGRTGESAAADYLISKGYTILQQNVRFQKGEIDIVAVDGKFLVIVEVKTRKNAAFGKPYESVNKTKQRRMTLLARQFVSATRLGKSPIRFDVISILKNPDNSLEIEHLKDAFKAWDV
jgi:putative endonuclease